MSKKDFDKYVLVIENQYKQFKDTLEQVSKEIENTLTDIDFMENLEKQVNLYKQNYERVIYIKYLLDQPSRKKKLSKHNKMIFNKIKNLDKNNSTEAVLEENKKIIDSMGGN